MELSALSNVDLINAFKVPEISSSLDDSSTGKVQGNGAFEALFNSAANMISDANDYSNAAEVEERQRVFMISRLRNRKLIFHYNMSWR